MFLPPPPFWIDTFTPNEILYNEVVRAAGENVQPFFGHFCTFKVNWGKNVHTFTNWGKNMHIPTFFHPFFNNFFPQHVIWPYFRPRWGQTEKYTPLL